MASEDGLRSKIYSTEEVLTFFQGQDESDSESSSRLLDSEEDNCSDYGTSEDEFVEKRRKISVGNGCSCYDPVEDSSTSDEETMEEFSLQQNDPTMQYPSLLGTGRDLGGGDGDDEGGEVSGGEGDDDDEGGECSGVEGNGDDEGGKCSGEEGDGDDEGGEVSGGEGDGDDEGGECSGGEGDGDDEGGKCSGEEGDGDDEGGECSGEEGDGDDEGGKCSGEEGDGDDEGGEVSGGEEDGDDEGGECSGVGDVDDERGQCSGVEEEISDSAEEGTNTAESNVSELDGEIESGYMGTSKGCGRGSCGSRGTGRGSRGGRGRGRGSRGGRGRGRGGSGSRGRDRGSRGNRGRGRANGTGSAAMSVPETSKPIFTEDDGFTPQKEFEPLRAPGPHFPDTLPSNPSELDLFRFFVDDEVLES